MNKTLNIILVIIILVLTIFYLYNFPNKTTENFYLGISQILAGIISGALTLLGVNFTISNQEKSRIEDSKQIEKRQKDQIRLENLPVFQYIFNPENKSKDGSITYIDCDTNETKTTDWKLNISLRNIGLRAAQHIWFQLIIDGKSDNGRQGMKDSLIKPDEFSETTFYFKTKYIEKKEITKEYFNNPQFMSDPELNVYHSLKIIVYYDDLIGNHYMQELDGALSIGFSSSDDSDVVHVSNSIGIRAEENYKIIEDNYVYIVPKETIDFAEKRKREQVDIVKFSKIEFKVEIDKLVEEFLSKNKIYKYNPWIYRNIEFKFGGGSGCTDYEEIEKNKIYCVTIEMNKSVDGTHGIALNYLLTVDLSKNIVTKIYVKVIKNNLQVNTLKRIIANISFKNNYKFSKYLKEQYNNNLRSNSNYIIKKKKILCQGCNTKNGIKREHCWMCGKKLEK